MTRRVILAAVAIAGLATAGVIGQAHADEQPKRVTGVSFALNAMRTGNRLGPGIVYGLALSTAGSAVPAKGTLGPADPVVQQAGQQLLVAAVSQGDTVSKVSEAGDSGIAQTQSAVQPLAALNAPANQVIDSAAGALDTGATTLGPQIQPFDTTLKQVGQLARGTEAPPGG
jgi:hypothetical protein